MKTGILSLIAAAAIVGAAHAQPAAPAFKIVRGSVIALDGDHLSVKTREGAVVDVTLTKTWTVAVTKAVTASQIVVGSFIGTTNMPETDGAGRSLEVHVFPPGVKMGEGHYGWDLQPGSMMTNGTVGKVLAGSNGQELDVSYSTGTRHIRVPAKTPIVQIVPGDRSLVRPGVKVFLVTAPQPSGGVVSNSVSVGENGAAPPM